MTVKNIKEAAGGLFNTIHVLMVESDKGFVGSITLFDKTDLPTLLAFSKVCTEQGYDLVLCELYPHNPSKIQIRILGRKL